MTGYDTGGAIDINGNKIVYLKHNDLANMDLGDVFVYNIATGKSKNCLPVTLHKHRFCPAML